ncbi:Serine/threonine protein kinase [Arthrobacter sp. cf158]|uniref:serine/threonine-protein kinase n=1 Tax=Arthrobacter sp. cf158 TaxID=1761744 RepID=UPI00089CC664|nr:serine/threonine-protein kinase [Arthrobacter sp. cf158]SDX58413.1 Serine/threonine protein kinase [Arthrobacter sp. cf158]
MTLLDTPAVRADRGAECADRGVDEAQIVLGGRYRLGAPLGGGSEANVNEALDLETGTSVAVKIFRTCDDAPYDREMKIHSRLRHKNIVRVLGSSGVQLRREELEGEHDARRNYLVMDLVEGKDLRWILQQAPASEVQTVAWMTGIARALTHLHRRGVVHNDIKPGNILVDFTADPKGPGIAKLTDFGIAINGRQAAPNSSSGTPHYLSPEEVCGGESTSASDIYSLGLVALECLTGTKAFPGAPLESMVARTLGEPRIPGTVRRRWSMVLHAMTDPNPAGRPSASQTVGMLRRLSW